MSSSTLRRKDRLYTEWERKESLGPLEDEDPDAKHLERGTEWQERERCQWAEVQHRESWVKARTERRNTATVLIKCFHVFMYLMVFCSVKTDAPLLFESLLPLFDREGYDPLDLNIGCYRWLMMAAVSVCRVCKRDATKITVSYRQPRFSLTITCLRHTEIR